MLDTVVGVDGFMYSMLAHAGLAREVAILAMYDHDWWNASCLCGRWLISKPKESTKLRPISLMSCTAKTVE